MLKINSVLRPLARYSSSTANISDKNTKISVQDLYALLRDRAYDFDSPSAPLRYKCQQPLLAEEVKRRAATYIDQVQRLCIKIVGSIVYLW